MWEGVGLPPSPGLGGGLCPPRGTLTDWSPHSSCFFLLGLTMCLFGAAWADITEHSSKSQRLVRLQFPEGQKRWVKHHCHAEAFSLHPTGLKFGAWDILA